MYSYRGPIKNNKSKRQDLRKIKEKHFKKVLMNKSAIMQPTFFPWTGYFDLIDEVDTFVFLDDVQFDYRSWQHKNNIKDLSSKNLTLTVPVLNGQKQKTK